MAKIKVGGRYKYLAQPPEAVLMQKEQRLDQFKDLIPFLKKLGAKDGQTDIRFFEGCEGIQEIHNDIILSFRIADRSLEDNDSLLSFSAGANVLKIFPNIQKAFIDKRVDLRVNYKAICPSESEIKNEFTNDPAALREVKFVENPVFDFSIQMEIYLDKVMIFSPVKPYGGLIIQNENIASSLRSLFKLLWTSLPA